jgi:hypothetical protein
MGTIRRILFVLAVALVSFVAHAQTAAAALTLCIELQVLTTDSGEVAPGGFVEDYYQTCDDDDGAGPDLGCSAYARGMRMALKTGGVTTVYNLNASGCVGGIPANNNMELTLYGLATTPSGALVRIHNGSAGGIGDAGNNYYPGGTYSIQDPDLDLAAFNNQTVTMGYGNYDEKWTTMAALAFSYWRRPEKLSNGDRVQVAFDTTFGACYSSAHYPNSTSRDSEGDHYLRIARCAGNNNTRLKFVVGHELGHAIACIAAGEDGCEPNVVTTHSVAPDNCAIPGGTYSMGSKEWNSVGFREGFAHFFSASVWNDPESRGQFRLGQNYNLEYFSGSNNPPGGRLENVCCVPEEDDCESSWEGAGTNEDWMNFFWDWRTNDSASCPYQPSASDMLQLYSYVVQLDPPAEDTYLGLMLNAAGILVNLPACLRENWPTSRTHFYAVHNGIDN